MVTKIYASRQREAFDNITVRATDIKKHGGFYVVAIPRELPGTFEIVAELTDSAFVITHNSAQIGYDEMTDLLEWASHTQH
jgi:hypothetical protein